MNIDNKVGRKLIKKEKSSLLIERKKIKNILDRILDLKIIYVSGTISSGKTTIVKEWCNDIDIETIWYSIEDNMYYSELIEIINKKITKKSQYNIDVIIIIDNFENIVNKNKLNFSFFDEVPNNYKFIFISRSLLPNGLKYFLVKRELEIVSDTNLLLSNEEILEYFTINRFKITNNQAEEIRKISRGWIMGINAIIGALKVNNNEFNEKMYADSIVNSYEYLNYKIFKGASGEIKRFCLETSLVDEIDIGLAKLITENEKASEKFNAFIEKYNFVVKIRTGVYKYNSYTRDYFKYLREKVYSEEQINSIYKKIADYYFVNHKKIEALEYYCRGKYYNNSIQILEKLVFEQNKNLELKVVDEYMDIIPKEYINKSASLCWITFLNSFIYNKDNLKTAYKNLLHMRKIIPESSSEKYFLESRILYAKISFPETRIKKIIKNFRNYILIAKDNNNYLNSVCITLNLPSILRGIRDFSSWGFHYEFIELILKRDVIKIFGNEGAGMIDIAIAELLYEKNDLKNALIRASKGVADSSVEGHISIYFVGMVLLVKILRAQGENCRVEELLEILEKKIKTEKAFYIKDNLKAVKTRFSLTKKSLSECIEWLNNLNESVIDNFAINKIYIYITKARVYMANNMYSEALINLEALSVKLRNMNRTLDIIEINILRSICFYGYGGENMSLHYMGKALKSAFRYKYIRVFANEGKLCATILNKYLKSKKDLKGEYRIYIKKLIDDSNKSVIAFPDKIVNTCVEKFQPLTRAEEEILKLLFNGYKYAEIGERLDIKVSTVKTHISNIYNKLGVKSKNEAILVMNHIKKQ